MRYNLDYTKIFGVSVFMQQRSTRMFVGTLEYSEGQYHFIYDNHYLSYKKAISLGPALPLTQRSFKAEKIFPFFEDRIPSKNNPEYSNYCKQFGIDPDEENILILLSTIGKRGPSSFVFEPKWRESFSREDLRNFRYNLGLSTRDFAEGFGSSQATIVRIENKMASGEEVLKMLDILNKFPDAAAYYVEKYAHSLHSRTKERLVTMLKSQQLGCWADVITDREYDFSKSAAQTLKGTPWAKEMFQRDEIKKALEYGSNPNAQPLGKTKAALFELRFARALCESKLVAEYEYKTGVGNSSVDFMVHNPGKNQPAWLIELTSLIKSDAVKESTTIIQEPDTPDLYAYSSSTRDGDTTNSAEVRDIIKVQQAILGKVAELDKDGKVKKIIKFPEIDVGKRGSQPYHVIIVDIRTFNMGMSDIADYINILYGNESFPDEYKRYFIKDGKKKLIRGVLDKDHPDKRSQYLQENVHAIGFVKEKQYELGEINSDIKLYANIHIPGISHDKIRELWPLGIQ